MIDERLTVANDHIFHRSAQGPKTASNEARKGVANTQVQLDPRSDGVYLFIIQVHKPSSSRKNMAILD